MKTGLRLIQIERRKQISKHHYTKKRDLMNNPSGELGKAAAWILKLKKLGRLDFNSSSSLIVEIPGYPKNWWQGHAWNWYNMSDVERLIVAGALYQAEFDRQIYLFNTYPSALPKYIREFDKLAALKGKITKIANQIDKLNEAKN